MPLPHNLRFLRVFIICLWLIFKGNFSHSLKITSHLNDSSLWLNRTGLLRALSCDHAEMMEERISSGPGTLNFSNTVCISRHNTLAVMWGISVRLIVFSGGSQLGPLPWGRRQDTTAALRCICYLSALAHSLYLNDGSQHPLPQWRSTRPRPSPHGRGA